MSESQTVEHFFGVYLLYCLNPQHKGSIYIGYTVDPNRRIKQHNKGKEYGGACKTNNRGPWSMVMIIHGFPNDISALRFEWAWQNPRRSRRLKHVSKKRKNETRYDFSLRVLSHMLGVGPWCRLPLNIRWLNSEFVKDFPVNNLPPMHMSICHGNVVSKKLSKNSQEINAISSNSVCTICLELLEEKQMRCLNSSCDLNSHIKCLSKYFIEDGEYVPLEGKCPSCQTTYLWGDIVRKYKGCYNNLDVEIDITLS